VHGCLIIPVILKQKNLKKIKYLQVIQINIEYHLSEHFFQNRYFQALKKKDKANKFARKKNVTT